MATAETITAPATTATASLFERLKAAAAPSWTAYTEHAFVQALADASLPEVCFRQYLTQDYLFLIQFARAYGLAVFKADGLADIRHAAAGLSAMIDQEMGLHVAYCRRWQLEEAEMAATAEADATIAYTRFVLERGSAGDLLDLYVALAPCVVGYAEIGRRLIEAASTRLDGNPYRDWIEMYASAEYQEVAASHIEQMDRLMERRGGPGRIASLETVFRQATRLEEAFWQMGLAAASDS